MTPHEILVNARNLIEAKGWGQATNPGGIFDGPGYCASTACGNAGDNEGLGARRALLVVLGGDSNGPTFQLFRWNDAPGRTKEEVLALFDEAIRQTAPAPDTSFLNDRIAERDQNTAFFGPMFEEAKS